MPEGLSGAGWGMAQGGGADVSAMRGDPDAESTGQAGETGVGGEGDQDATEATRTTGEEGLLVWGVQGVDAEAVAEDVHHLAGRIG
jgi:hypothetical protein